MLTPQEFMAQYCDNDVKRYNAIIEDGRRNCLSWEELVNKGYTPAPTAQNSTSKEFLKKHCDGDVERYNATLANGRRECISWDNLIKSDS